MAKLSKSAKTAGKKTSAKKTGAPKKKPTAKKAAVKKVKAAPKKAAPQKAPAKKAPVKKAPPKKAAPKVTPPKKATFSLAAMAAPATDGRLEVCQAIQMTSALVSVDVSTTPFTTQPRDLSLRAFNDEKVGISDPQMSLFKAHLKILLPGIDAQIDGIAEDAGQIVSSVQRIVMLALNG